MDTALSPLALSDLIGSIYDCALEPSRWPQTLAQLCQQLDFASGTMTVQALPTGSVLLNVISPIDPVWQGRAWDFGAEALEIWGGLENVARAVVGEPVVLSRVRERSTWENNRIFREWLTPQGIHDLMTVPVAREGTMAASLGLSRHRAAGEIGDPEIEAARLFAPHLLRCVTISKLLDLKSIVASTFKTALDKLRCAVVLTDERGAILHANQAAEQMLRDGGPIGGAAGVLTARAPSAAAEMRAAIRLAAEGEAGIGKTGLAIRLTEPEAPPVIAHVLPLTGGDVRTRLQPAAVAAVFISAAPDEQDGADAMAAAFGLTPAETRVLTSLLAGHTLAETAAALGIAATTAKTHLDHIFWKTGMTRQADLMRLGTGLVPPTRSNS
jgi:DNA-binding CsgD family transcriptional regulator/PAS domain-containing protein